jgi:glycerophosphoryl diester phosphodiesterase
MKPPRPRAAMLLLALALALAPAVAAAFDLQGHRGARGLLPENTLPAFERALALGVTTLELDVGITADDRVIVAHDRRLNPDITRGADGAWIASPGPAIRALTLAELRRFDVGALKPGTRYGASFAAQEPRPGTTMPTLEEVVALARARGAAPRYNIETKLSPLAPEETAAPAHFARTLIAEIRRLGIADRAAVQSFDWRSLAVVAREAPEIVRVHLTSERGGGDTVFKGKGVSPWTGIDAASHGDSTPRIVAAAGGRHWSPNFNDLTPEAMAEARRLGLVVVPWTVNEIAQMRRLIELGVDGLITDYPDAALDVLRRLAIAPAR